MAKEYKCKKCKLTYNKKLHECPYCHAKRFNPAGLIIILLVIIVGGAAYYFKGDKIIEAISNIQKSENKVDGIIFRTVSVEQKTSIRNEQNKIVTITFETENTNDKDVKLDYEITTYVDDCLTEQYANGLGDYEIRWTWDTTSDTIAAKKKCNYSFWIETKENWDKIEIMCKKKDKEENSQSIPIIKINNNEE